MTVRFLILLILACRGLIFAEDTPIRIMCVGDSITEGGSKFEVYRRPLYQKLKVGEFTFQFVGSKSRTEQGVALQHEGYGGNNIAQLAKKVPANFEKHPADVLLLHAGHNNFAKNKPVPGVIRSTRLLIEQCRKTNPDLTIFLGQVITSLKLPKYSYIPELNTELANLARELNTQKSPVILVNHADGFDPATMTIGDRVHPNAKGAAHMAEKWNQALRKHYAK